MEAIIGLAIKAGSIPTFLAAIGSILPILFAAITIINMEAQTASPIHGPSPSSQQILAKLSRLKITPIIKLTLTSFQALCLRLSIQHLQEPYHESQELLTEIRSFLQCP